jgi:hypothetical protein
MLSVTSCTLPGADCAAQRPGGGTNFAALVCHATNGDRSAQVTLARAYETGAGLPQDMKMAVEWYRRAAAPKTGKMPVYVAPVGNQKYGNVMMLDSGTETPGDAWAQFRLGEIYLAGKGVRQSDRRARKWLRRSAAQGYDPAAELLAKMEEGGE